MKRTLTLAGILIAILAVYIWKGKQTPTVDLTVSEFFEGITWDTNYSTATKMLNNNGFQAAPRSNDMLYAASFTDLQGIKGANGTISIKNENGLVGHVFISFSDTDKDLMETLFNSYTKEFDKIIDKKVSKEAYESKCPDVMPYDKYAFWLGTNSFITVNYSEDGKLLVCYEPPKTEFSTYLKKLFY